MASQLEPEEPREEPEELRADVRMREERQGAGEGRRDARLRRQLQQKAIPQTGVLIWTSFNPSLISST